MPLFGSIIRLAVNLVGFSFMIQGKVVEGMMFIVSAQLMAVQLTLDTRIAGVINADAVAAEIKKKKDADGKAD